MTIQADFTTMTVNQLAAFAVSQRNELGIDGLEICDITVAIAEGRVALQLRPYGFAVIELKSTTNGGPMPHLWLLYLAPQHRNQGQGRRFMRELLRLYAHEYHMSLWCYGARRRAFFGRLGFRIESRDGEMRRMTTGELR